MQGVCHASDCHTIGKVKNMLGQNDSEIEEVEIIDDVNSLEESEDYSIVYNDGVETRLARRIRAVRSGIFRQKRVVVIVDGPNMIRKIGGREIKMDDITEVASRLGRPILKKIFFNTQVSDKLIEATENAGFEPVITLNQIHLEIAAESIDMLYEHSPQIILLATRDAKCSPIIFKLKSKGIETAVVGFEPGFSKALQNSADHVFHIRSNKESSRNNKESSRNNKKTPRRREGV